MTGKQRLWVTFHS